MVTQVNIINGDKIPISKHELFDDRWNEFTKKYNKFVEETNLNSKQIRALEELLESSGAVERLGYLGCYNIGYSE